ncbi:hypothetical protein ACWDOR_05975 [Streptosporangium canum]
MRVILDPDRLPAPDSVAPESGVFPWDDLREELGNIRRSLD